MLTSLLALENEVQLQISKKYLCVTDWVNVIGFLLLNKCSTVE